MILDDAQIDWITAKVNEKINVPILGEKAEGKFIRKALLKVLAKLEQELPPEVLRLITDAAEGVNPGDDISEIKANTVDFLNKEINLPILNEKKEAELFTIVVDLLFDAMQKGKSVPTA